MGERVQIQSVLAMFGQAYIVIFGTCATIWGNKVAVPFSEYKLIWYFYRKRMGKRVQILYDLVLHCGKKILSYCQNCPLSRRTKQYQIFSINFFPKFFHHSSTTNVRVLFWISFETEDIHQFLINSCSSQGIQFEMIHDIELNSWSLILFLESSSLWNFISHDKETHSNSSSLPIQIYLLVAQASKFRSLVWWVWRTTSLEINQSWLNNQIMLDVGVCYDELNNFQCSS